MKLILSALVFIALLNGCVSNSVKARTDLCRYENVEELSGKYTNLGVGKLRGRVVYLSEVIWLLSNNKAKFEHDDIAVVTIESENHKITALATSKSNESHFVRFDAIVEFDEGSIKLYHELNVLPTPSGGLVVGPQIVDINLNQDCSGNLVVHKFESVSGLLLLLIPVSSEVNSYVTFHRVNEN